MAHTETSADKEREPLRDAVHDLRSSLSAAVAYLHLARERMREGRDDADEDLERLAGSLKKVGAVTDRLDALTREERL